MSYKREHDSVGLNKARIDAALEQFWLDRAKSAPTREALDTHLREEERLMTALERKRKDEQ